jgi:hypothetical protein
MIQGLSYRAEQYYVSDTYPSRIGKGLCERPRAHK